MNNEWNSFIESIKMQYSGRKGKEEHQLSEMNQLGKLSIEQANWIQESLEYAFRSYRQASTNEKKELDQLLKLHVEICRDRPWDVLLKRRHNVLVYKYVVNTIAANKVIAMQLGISKETLYQDLNRAMGEMTILSAGVPYLISGNRGKIKIGLILDNYHFLTRCSPDVHILFPCKMQGEIKQYFKQTQVTMECFHQCVALYEQFCSTIDNLVNKRRYSILQAFLLKGSGTIKDIAKEHLVSLETAYFDMRENTKRLQEIMSIIAIHKVYILSYG